MTGQRQKRLRELIRRSRARLMVRDPALAMVLMYMSFAATKKVQRISTNGRIIFFDPDWLQKLSPTELDYILSHQVIHTVLEDTKRPAFFTGDRYHHACDIIACSIMRERGWNYDKLPHIGNLPCRTYFPGHEGSELEPLQAYRDVPFDPSALSPGERRRFLIDSDAFWGSKELPCDATLVLHPGYDDMREMPVEEEKGKEIRVKVLSGQPAILLGISDDIEDEPAEAPPVPDFELEDSYSELDAAIDRLLNMIKEMESTDPRQNELLERIWKGIGASKLEWRRLLASFLQEEINDYSFQPPDRRFTDSDFFLPDFNQGEGLLKDILFMVDSSGSIDDDMIAEVYGEICAAIELFDGSLQGKLGFFDTQVVTPAPFSSVHQLLKIRPKGYGGTDFGCVFRWISRNYSTLPACLVIFTDGIGEFPPETEALGIPVIWIIYGKAALPPWGKTARITK